MASFDPVRIPVVLAGFIYEWSFTRRWTKILIGAIPFLLLLGLALAVWAGGGMDRNKLAERYKTLYEPFVSEWEARMFTRLTEPPKQPASNNSSAATQPVESESEALSQDESEGSHVTEELDSESKPNEESVADSNVALDNENTAEANPTNELLIDPYGEMLCKRAELLRESNQTKFVIGTNMLMRGQLVPGHNMLEKISPDASEGDPKGHAVRAFVYHEQLKHTQKREFIPKFEHHAELAGNWSEAPKAVLMMAADTLLRKRNVDRSLEVTQVAADRYPELLPVLFERSRMVGKADMAESARQKAIQNLQAKLDENPADSLVRVQMAQLLAFKEGTLDQVESLLKEGLELGPSPELSRALSEVYRIRFVNMLVEKKGKVDDFSLLETAMKTDPNNPMVAEWVARLVRDGIRPPQELRKALQEKLTSGTATPDTHATLSEYYLAANKRPEAIMHLEKVFERAPQHVKYANNLAYLYAADERLDDAENVAKKCLEILQRMNVQQQRYVDELLDTLGMVYQKQKKYTDAISAYELALRFNTNRVDTRTRLAEIYEEMGNVDVAKAQRQFIEDIKKEAKENASATTSGEENATGTTPEKAESENAQPEEATEPESVPETTPDDLLSED